MSLALLQIENLRNIKQTRLNLHPKFNLIIGANGSGKTSLLEALYLLGSGHSFRTREISPLVSQGAEYLTVFARKADEQRISIQKSLSSPTQVRLNGYPCQSSSELAHFLPAQVFYQDLFQIIDAGPVVRRSLLDWGLFHVKQDYHELWKNYRRALKQRNSLLRQKASPSHLLPWDRILADLAMQLDAYRADYFLQLNEIFQLLLPRLTRLECTLNYYKGWDKKGSGKALNLILADSYQSDLHRQFTQYGAHQADLIVQARDFKVKQFLSRGQQKIILFALKLAQAKLTTKPCLFLCDDLPSELDRLHVEKLLTLFDEMKGQFFITSTSLDNLIFALSAISAKVFNVNEGSFSSDDSCHYPC